MIAAWACSTKTFVRVEDDGVIRVFPPDSLLPDWRRVAAAVAAGTLTIADYAPPAAPSSAALAAPSPE